MKPQPVVAATVAVIVLTTLVSGPLVSAVDLTGTGSFSGGDLGEGRATIGDVTLPDRVAFERGDFGADAYYLRVPSTTVELREVIGQPILSYEVSVPELGYTKSTVHVVSSANEGTYEMALDEQAFGRNEIRNDSYAGKLRVDLRIGETERVLASKNVTIEVVG